MSSSPLERVEQDLQVIKSAIPSDFPYDRGSLTISAAAALCGVPLALRAVPGWDGAMLGVLLALIAGLVLVSGRWWKRAYSERGIRPRRWSWGRWAPYTCSRAAPRNEPGRLRLRAQR